MQIEKERGLTTILYIKKRRKKSMATILVETVYRKCQSGWNLLLGRGRVLAAR